MATQPVTVLIPVKQLQQAKTRLQPNLTSQQRVKLMQVLVNDLLDRMGSLLDSSYTVAVVTPDSWVEERAREAGAAVVEEPPDARTLGEVVDQAAKTLEPSGPLAVFPADLPLINDGIVRELAETFEGTPVGLVPDADHQGTNFLWRQPYDAVPCQYSGTASFEAHRDVARQQAQTPRIVERQELLVDLDDPEDLTGLTHLENQLTNRLQQFLSEELGVMR